LVSIFSIHAASAIALANPPDTRLGSAQRRKDMRGRVGCAEVMEDEGFFFEPFFSSFVSMIVLPAEGKEEHVWKRMDLCDRPKDGRKEGRICCCFIYTPVFTASQFS